MVVVRRGEVGDEVVAVMHGHSVTVEQANEVIVTDVVDAESNAHIALLHVIEVLLAHELVPDPEAAPVLEGRAKVRQSWPMVLTVQATVELLTYMDSR